MKQRKENPIPLYHFYSISDVELQPGSPGGTDHLSADHYESKFSCLLVWTIHMYVNSMTRGQEISDGGRQAVVAAHQYGKVMKPQLNLSLSPLPAGDISQAFHLLQRIPNTLVNVHLTN